MDPISSKTALASAGAGGESLYVDDVFSTFLYEGNKDEFTSTPPATQNIVNNIDNVANKGLVWQKVRTYSGSQGFTWSHYLTDTERGATKVLRSDATNGETTENAVTSFNTNGFTAGSFNLTNNDKAENVAWNFRAAPGFFDVVTYTGTGSVQNISHNLGSTPGMIIVKQTSSTESWGVYHRSLAASETVLLNGTNNAFSSPNSWNSTAPTSSVFTVGTETRVNASGHTYVAYLFAHDNQSFGTDSDEAIVHCGTFNGGGVGNINTIEVNTGFEPQFVLIKRTDSTSDWYIYDTMRGMADDGFNDQALFANTSGTEGTPFRFWVYQNGFAFDEDLGGSSAEWIYMAIRRPNKPPEAGTDVFSPIATTAATGTNLTTGFPVDWQIVKDNRTGTNGMYSMGRLTGVNTKDAANNFPHLRTNDTSAEGVSSLTRQWDNTGYDIPLAFGSNSSIYWNFRRAPGFFDVVNYRGTGSQRTIYHNLGVTPELMIVKNRDANDYWAVYHKDVGPQKYLRFNGIDVAATLNTAWNDTAPTSSVFSVWTGATNTNNDKHIAYLFASLNGISKVGSYTGNGTSQVIDCGFTAGARFVLIKATGVANDWRVFDTARGINASANDPVLSINLSNAEDPNKDWLRPNNSGFEVNTSNDNVNGNNEQYIFLAIA